MKAASDTANIPMIAAKFATGVFDHGCQGIILCLRGAGVGALGEHVIKIKYFVGSFITDVRIAHAVYVP